MALFQPSYDDEQRDAIEQAVLDRGVRPYRRVAELAAAGDLVKDKPFTIPVSSIAYIARQARKRRDGRIESPLASKPPRDAIETLRVSLVNLIDEERQQLEKQKKGQRDIPRITQAARALLELARIPGPTDPRPASAATRDTEGKHGPQVTGGKAGALLQDHRRSSPGGETEHDVPATAHAHGDTTHASDTHAMNDSTTEHNDGSPGAWAREQVGVLGAREVEVG